MSGDRQNKFRPVNAMLGTQPKFGFIPSEQLVPWFFISGGMYCLAQILQLNAAWTVLLIFWGDAVWWVVTGSKPWKFLSKFVATPQWTRGNVRYISTLDYFGIQHKKRSSLPRIRP